MRMRIVLLIRIDLFRLSLHDNYRVIFSIQSNFFIDFSIAIISFDMNNDCTLKYTLLSNLHGRQTNIERFQADAFFVNTLLITHNINLNLLGMHRVTCFHHNKSIGSIYHTRNIIYLGICVNNQFLEKS